MHCLDKVTNSVCKKKNGLLLLTKLCINFILGLACCDPNQCWQTHRIFPLPVFCTSTKLSLHVHSIFYNTEVSRQTVYFWNTLILTCQNSFLPFKDNVFIYFMIIFVIHWTQICPSRFSHHPALYYSQLHLS